MSTKKSMKKKYTGVVVKHDNKVLLCKRNNQGSLPGEWSIPGGKLEKGETPIDGAAREFYEETAIKVNNPLTFCGFIKRFHRDGTKLKGVMYTFLMEVEEQLNPDLENAIDGDEHIECGYFGIDELPSPIGEQTVDLIKHVLTMKVEA